MISQRPEAKFPPQDLTVSQVAAVLQRSRSSVVNLIMTGRLTAYDAAPEGKYRQWRVSLQSLDAFRSDNQAKKEDKTRRRRSLPKITREYV